MLTDAGGWADPVEGPSELAPELVREHQETMLRWRWMSDRIDVAEFERRMGFLIAADDWGWLDELAQVRLR